LQKLAHEDRYIFVVFKWTDLSKYWHYIDSTWQIADLCTPQQFDSV
jgi:hypothetical protein